MESMIIDCISGHFFALIPTQDLNHKIEVAPFNFVVLGTIDLQIFDSKKLVIDERRMSLFHDCERITNFLNIMIK